MLTKNEAFLVRELVRKHVVTLRDCVKLLHAKNGIDLNIHLLKQYQEEVKRYEIIYNKLLEEAKQDD